PLAPPDHRDGEAEDADDRGADGRQGVVGARVEQSVLPGDDVGGGATMPVREAGHGDQGRLGRDRVDLLHRVADGEDARVAGALQAVDGDAAGGTGDQPSIGGDGCRRPDAPGVDHDVGGDDAAVIEVHSVGIQRLDRGAHAQVDAAGAQLVHDEGGNLGVERTQRVHAVLHERHVEATVHEVLDGFESDETAAGDDRALLRFGGAA